MRLDPTIEFPRWKGPADPPGGLAGPEQDHGRNRPDIELGREAPLFVGVYLCESHARLELAGRGRKGRRHRPAGAAPFGPEIDQKGEVPRAGVGIKPLGGEDEGFPGKQGQLAVAAFPLLRPATGRNPIEFVAMGAWNVQAVGHA